MKYSRFIPKIPLRHLVEYFWIVEGEEITVQKIVPDGCPELIFHFGDPYKISSELKPEEVQSTALAAGQLLKPIFLRPTGKSGVLGMKFKPDGLWKIFGCDMHLLTDQTYGLGDVLDKRLDSLLEQVASSMSNDLRVEIIESFLFNQMIKSERRSDLDGIVAEIRNSHGQVSIRELSVKHKLSNRKIERLFQQQVGVSAKTYARLIRFTCVFNLSQQTSISKAEASYLSGYFDQAHFNNEFRAFTGETPHSYFKNNHTFSNFFLNR